jgi:hypothetical protein
MSVSRKIPFARYGPNKCKHYFYHMKKVISIVLFALLASTGSMAQRITDIQFAYFTPLPKNEPTTPTTVQVGHYKGSLLSSGYVSENPATKAQIIKLLNNLRNNGTGDINKCFIPRHAITVYSNDAVLYRVLVCFECDGIRFSSQSNTTTVKSVAKREKWMQELKAFFVKHHFAEKGSPE